MRHIRPFVVGHRRSCALLLFFTSVPGGSPHTPQPLVLFARVIRKIRPISIHEQNPVIVWFSAEACEEISDGLPLPNTDCLGGVMVVGITPGRVVGRCQHPTFWQALLLRLCRGRAIANHVSEKTKAMSFLKADDESIIVLTSLVQISVQKN